MKWWKSSRFLKLSESGWKYCNEMDTNIIMGGVNSSAQSNETKVLVIIVTYNGMRWIKRCLESLMSSTLIRGVYVIDNGSTDGTQDYIKENYSWVKFKQNKKNEGFGRANNIGLEYALENQYDYVYLLNQDAWMLPDNMEQLVEVQKQNPCYGILSPFQLQANMQKLDHNFGVGVCSMTSNNHLFEDFFFNRIKAVYEVPYVMAAHWLISRECLEKVGGFSPTFPHYGEDNNYAERVVYHGLKIGIVPKAVAVHDRAERKNSLGKDMYIGCLIDMLRALSNPFGKTLSLKTVLMWAYYNTYYTFSYARTEPLRYTWKLVCSLPKVIRNLKISKNRDCAFLNISHEHNAKDSYNHS